MASKNIPKKYMLILQKQYGGQEALAFLETGDAYTIDIKPFTDQRLNAPNKRSGIVPKNTLAFYDAITNKFNNFDQFLSIIGRNIYPFNYKENTSYIGFLNKKYMHTVRLSFNDPLLAQIALHADGNNINRRDPETMNIVASLIDLIEDPSSDFVSKLRSSYDNDDKRFNFSRSLIDSICTYRSTKKAMDTHNKYSSTMSDALNEDLEVFKKDFLDKVQSYKNFRELYRFRKQYLLDKKIVEEREFIQKDSTSVDSSDSFRERFEDVRAKTYSRVKQKTLNDQVPGQLSLFDLHNNK